MKGVVRILLLMLTGVVLVHGSPALGQKQQEKEPKGTKNLREDLPQILADHKQYLKTKGKKGKRADLTGADLTGADLSGFDLRKAILEKANLTKANLSKANLGKLDKADHPTGAKLDHAKLVGAVLSGAYLQTAVLTKAILTNAYLTGAHLTGADLRDANLTDADLSEANLSNADLTDADLTRANMKEADLSQAFFDVNAESVPDIRNIAFAKNLSKLRYHKSPKALVRLRQRFKNDGFRREEREITYAIKHTERQNLWKKGPTIFERLECLFNYAFFELTCLYGMSPGRPLMIATVLIPLFAFFYILALKTYRHKTGIWLVFPRDHLPKGKVQEKPRKLSSRLPCRPLPMGRIAKTRGVFSRWARMVRIAFYFSLLSAFGIGFREINVRNWITRLQRREYVLRPTGWVRILSGLQSLINVYLVSLWVVTYFGHPFETF